MVVFLSSVGSWEEKRLVRPILGGGGARVPQRQRVSPRARRGFAREVSPYSSLLGRCPFGRGVWGCVRVSPTPLSFLYPRRGACAREVPTRWLNCRCTPASAPFGSPSARGYPRRGAAALALKCAARLPNDGSAAFPLAALVRALRFPNESPWASHPRARFACALLVLKLTLLCPIGRGSRS